MGFHYFLLPVHLTVRYARKAIKNILVNFLERSFVCKKISKYLNILQNCFNGINEFCTLSSISEMSN